MTRQNKSGDKVQVTFQVDESAEVIRVTLFMELPKGFAFASRKLCVSKDYTCWGSTYELSRLSRERGGHSVSFERKQQLQAWLSRVGRDIRAICAGQLTEWDKTHGEKRAAFSSSNKDPGHNCPNAKRRLPRPKFAVGDKVTIVAKG